MGSGFDRVRREADAMWPEAVRQLSGARCEEQTKKPGREPASADRLDPRRSDRAVQRLARAD